MKPSLLREIARVAENDADALPPFSADEREHLVGLSFDLRERADALELPQRFRAWSHAWLRLAVGDRVRVERDERTFGKSFAGRAGTVVRIPRGQFGRSHCYVEFDLLPRERRVKVEFFEQTKLVRLGRRRAA